MTESSDSTHPLAASALAGQTLIKGHATENDFLFLLDPDYRVAMSASDIAAVCDRHAGIGADGLIRIVRTAALRGTESFLRAVPEAEWFMDYYNADGTVAEMCGNASRLFAQILCTEGLVTLADGESLTIGTRGGARTLTRVGDLWSVDMGPARLICPEEAVADPQADGWDTEVLVPGIEGPRAALSIAMPNPHTVVALADESELDAALFAGLTDSNTLSYTPTPAAGTNLELVVSLGRDGEGPDEVGHARMRVLERGVGETRSCGTGCCAVAVALHEWEGEGAPENYLIDVPGGQIGVYVGPDPWTEGATVILTGPATITGRVTVG